MDEELITIKTFSYNTETLLYEPEFEAAGIYYQLKDQETISIDPLVSNAIGGIKLQVMRKDLQNAVALVEKIEKNRKAIELEREITIDGKLYESILEECPKCGLENIYVKKYPFLIGLFYSFSKKNYYCKDCKHRWSQ